MLDFGFYNMDCMEGMKEFPDKYFDLAIVDPVYGDVTQGGYMKCTESVARIARAKTYHNSIWAQEKTTDDYFKELFRVSKNQIIWGGIILQNKYARIPNAGLCGTRNTRTELHTQIVNSLTLHSTERQEYLGFYGMDYSKKI